jgi:hypothetical protein
MSQVTASRVSSTPAQVSRWTHALRAWNTGRFLFCGGTTLLAIGFAGITGLLASVSRAGLFNPPKWINWFHLSAGAAVLTIAILGTRKVQRGLALLAAIAGTTIGVGGLLFAVYAASQHVSSRDVDFSDPAAHLVVGSLALWALRNSKYEHRDA